MNLHNSLISSIHGFENRASILLATNDDSRKGQNGARGVGHHHNNDNSNNNIPAM